MKGSTMQFTLYLFIQFLYINFLLRSPLNFCYYVLFFHFSLNTTMLPQLSLYLAINLNCTSFWINLKNSFSLCVYFLSLTLTLSVCAYKHNFLFFWCVEWIKGRRRENVCINKLRNENWGRNELKFIEIVSF